MAVKVKELKDDVLIDVKVNKNFYIMVKNVLFYLFQHRESDLDHQETIKKISSGKYEEMTDWEQSFHTLTLLIAEIERQVKEQNLYIEKEILEPGDEGYVAPTQE